jgi:RNA polymerase sigma-70 factor (ECF subfamily)
MSEASHRPRPDDTRSAFASLVLAHYGRLCGFAHRFVGSADVAEDLVQDVFIAVWRRFETFDRDDPLPYLYQAVRNRAVSFLRTQGSRARWEERAGPETDAAAPGPTPAGAVEAAEIRAALRRAVDALPERCRLIFTMNREQDLSYSEIARVLGLSLKTVETQMGRALRLLRERLRDHR